MSDEVFETFDQFWPSYVRAHANKANRTLHFVGTTMAIACVGGALLLRKPKLLLLAPLVGYGPAWVGHFFIEGNRPATFTHPLYSLRGDLLMWKKILDGSMDAEVERVLAMDRDAATAPRETNGAPHAVAQEQPRTSASTVN